MEHILQTADHDDHDQIWCLHHSLNDTHICIACLVQIIEDDTKLVVQKKTAISKLLSLTAELTEEFRMLLNENGQVTQHLLYVLINQFSITNETYVALAIEVCIKIVLLMKSDDLMYFLMDCTKLKVVSDCSKEEKKACFVLLGRLLNAIPSLGFKLLHEHGDILTSLVESLKIGSDEMKTAVVYALIYLPEEALLNFLPSSYTLQIMHSTLLILSDTTCLGLQVNTLGLLKKLLSFGEISDSLMKMNINGITLQSTMKKLLISKKDVLQIGTAQCISHFLAQQADCQNAKFLLEFDLAEFLFEALHTRKANQLEILFQCLLLMSREKEFYTRCHSVYGIDAIIGAINVCFELKNYKILCSAYSLLSDLLEKQPINIPLFISRSSVEQCLNIIHKGVTNHHQDVFKTSVSAFTNSLKKEHFHLPVQFNLLINIFEDITKKYLETNTTSNVFGKKQQLATGKQQNLDFHCELLLLLDVVAAGCSFYKSCQTDSAACEEQYSAPNCKTFSSSALHNFGDYLTRVTEDACMPLVMAGWDSFETNFPQVKILTILNHLHDIHDGELFPLTEKMTSAGFISAIIMSKMKSPENEERASELLWKICKCLSSKHFPGMKLPGWLDNGVLNLTDTDSLLHKMEQLQNSSFLEDTLLSLLLIGYLNYIHEFDFFSNNEQIEMITRWTLEMNFDMEDVFVLKPLIFFISWLNSAGQKISTETSSRMCQCIQNVPVGKWYTHDPTLVKLGFSNRLLSEGIGYSILEEWLSHTAYVDECMEKRDEKPVNEDTILGEMMSNQAFLDCLIGFLGCAFENVRKKTQEILHAYTKETGSLNFHILNDLVLEHLQKLFLSVTTPIDYHLKGLLEIADKLKSVSGSSISTKDVQIVYHVVKYISSNQEPAVEIVLQCLNYLSTYFAVDKSGESESSAQIATLMLQNKNFLKRLDNTQKLEEEKMSIAALKLIVGLICNCDSSQQVVDKLHISFEPIINRLTSDDFNTIFTVIEYFTAIFKASFKVPFIQFVQKRSHCYMPIFHMCVQDVKRLFIFLQGSILQEAPTIPSCIGNGGLLIRSFPFYPEATEMPCDGKSLSIKCMDAILKYLETNSLEEVLNQLLNQPGNSLFLDLVIYNCQENELQKCYLEFLEMIMVNERRGKLIKTSHLYSMCDFIVNTPVDDNNSVLIREFVKMIIQYRQDDIPKEMRESLLEKLEV